MVTLDTSAIVRFFVADDMEKCEKVRYLLKEADEILIPDGVFIELEFVLTRLYAFTKAEILTVYDFLVNRDNTQVSDLVYDAVNIYRNHSISFADSLIAVASKEGTLASFDKKLLKVKQVTPYWP